MITINADDFGWNESCSKAIIKAFNEGWIQTTTMICTGSYVDEAAQYALSCDMKDSVGIHFDLTEGQPLTAQMSGDPFFCDQTGAFHMHPDRYARLTQQQKENVYRELTAQARRFQQTGLSCHHADSHHHIHTAPNILPIVLQVMRECGIPRVRIQRNVGDISGLKRLYKGMFNRRLARKNLAYSQLFGSFADMEHIRSAPDDKTLEIMCHPDFDRDGVLVDRDSMAPYDEPYGKELAILVGDIKAASDR